MLVSLHQPLLLDLTAAALYEAPTLEGFAGRVSDSGEGRWTAVAAIEEGVPTPVLTFNSVNLNVIAAALPSGPAISTLTGMP